MPLITIVCSAYNHEKYIKNALDGFLMQKTEYSFEVVVTDDASTDNTANIIREYQKKNPEIIKPVLYKENQYSKGITVARVARESSKSKYIAICEGDDYWIDSDKLQKQISYMESHPNCTFCFTNSKEEFSDHIVDRFVPSCREAILPVGKEDFNVGELAMLDFIPTASFVYRNGLSFPKMPEGTFLGDKYIALSMTSHGYAHFINEETCVYRRDVPGSLTSQWSNHDTNYVIARKAMASLYYEIDKYTNYEFTDELNCVAIRTLIAMYFRTGNIKELKKIKKEGKTKYLKRGNTYTKIVYGSICAFPSLISVVRYIGGYKPKYK